MNPSKDSEAMVKITYFKGDGETEEQPSKVAPESRETTLVNALLGSADDASHDAAIKVESTNGVPIVAERSMYFNYHGKWSGGSAR